MVTVTIDTEGAVSEAKVFKAVAPELNEAALEVAKKCVFKFAKYKGKKVNVKFNIPLRFGLDKKKKA